MSIEDDMQLVNGEEPEQQASDEDDKDTPLARRTRSARASNPRRLILPPAIMPDTDSDQELADEPHQTKLKGKPKNKYYRQVLGNFVSRRRYPGADSNIRNIVAWIRQEPPPLLSRRYNRPDQLGTSWDRSGRAPLRI